MTNLWKRIKWIWKFSPVIWATLLCLTTVVLSGIIFGPIGFAVAITVVALYIIIRRIWEKNSDDIKDHCKDWWKDKP